MGIIKLFKPFFSVKRRRIRSKQQKRKNRRTRKHRIRGMRGG